MNFHKDLAKSAILQITRLIEAHCHYYLARGNQFFPFINPLVGIRTSPPCKLHPREAWGYGMDKVQHGMTQLLSHEVYENQVEGAVAEVGVFRGLNAAVLNYFFPDRKLYLFDTFEGFDQRDLKAEVQLGYDIEKYDDFSRTTIDLVMSKMSHKENVIIRKGWFPESAAGLEEEAFSFVCIDADLYQPIYGGLHWFFPRLARGGYIVVDDFNWADYPGAKKAVKDFCREAGVGYTPIPNSTGGVVIGKPMSRPAASG